MKMINNFINFITEHLLLFIFSICVFEIVVIFIISPQSLHITNSIIICLCWLISIIKYIKEKNI
jgi:hypothetical protein